MSVVNTKPIKIAVVGDVHDQWENDDTLALKSLEIDLVLLVGDFGNEAVELVKTIAALEIPKAVVFGNHDAWYTATEWGRKKCPYNRQTEDWVQEQLDIMGEDHVGYGKQDFPDLQLTVVGGRPFSWGGPEWKYSDFYEERFGVNNFATSAQRMIKAVQSARFERILFLGHNGPTGLGEAAEAPCGKDWSPLGGDYGDPDFAEAIAQARILGKTIPLVAFGHMHHTLRHTKTRLRQRLVTSPDGTVYLNAACVSRIRETPQGKQRNFSLVTLDSEQVSEVSLVWVDEDFQVVETELLYSSTALLAQSAFVL
ncbi:TIGR04168 family protein [Planktothrix sp. FACHB-1365]|uniref:TIGR04168 family protein n=1 Tax=Planktothrix sp. FACHB-1365 TaxID=2692855 RepID=UPI0016826067|nr:TIGR04168 family protein [Planktothrix sp. FACHB-1365]